MPIRVAAIDREIEAATTLGCTQLVILGAGLDTRAWRLRTLSGVATYEIDHPATQAYKVQRTRGIPRVAKSIAFIPVDLGADPTFTQPSLVLPHRVLLGRVQLPI